MTVNGTLKRWNGASWEYVGAQPLPHSHQLTDIASLGAMPTRVSRRATSWLRQDPITGRGGWLGTGGVTDGTVTYGNYRPLYAAVDNCSDLVVVLANQYGHEDVPVPNAIVVSASLEYPLGATPVQFLFGGRKSVTIDPGGIIRSDPLGVQVPAGAVFYIRVNVQPASNVGTGGVWPLGAAPTGAVGGLAELAETGTGANVDKTASGTIGSNNLFMYKPIAVLGAAATIPTRTICVVGDSLSIGTGDNTGPFPLGGTGYIRRAINNTIPTIHLGMGGERAQWMATDLNRVVRGTLIAGASHVISNLSINDFINGRTTAQWQADILAVATYCARRGAKFYQTTLTPRTASTDSFATPGNQTPFGGTADPAGYELARQAANTWLVAGAPIDPATLAAVAVGTPGALVVGNALHPMAGVYNVNAGIETNAAGVLTFNGGYWLTDGTAFKYTVDGTHPATPGHLLMMLGIDLTVLV